MTGLAWIERALDAIELGRDAWRSIRNWRARRQIEAELDEIRDRIEEAERRIQWPEPPPGWEGVKRNGT